MQADEHASSADAGLDNAAAGRWADSLRQLSTHSSGPAHLHSEGKLTRMVGLTLEAVGCKAAIGERCQVVDKRNSSVEAEVVGFQDERLFLMPRAGVRGMTPRARVIPCGESTRIPVGEALLGRVIDSAGNVLDNGAPLQSLEQRDLHAEPVNPLARQRVGEVLDVGVRSINALLSVARGQRIGLFAPSGVGKSVLLGMMTRFSDADVIVVGLIGERGREVKEFIEEILGQAGMQRAVVVASPADTPPLLRMHGAAAATTIAEYFRDAGHNVLLLMDSLTRYAQAQREIALTIGEPPATRGYPPSVFARLPQLVERAGAGVPGTGSITAFYTILTEPDDPNDPIADAAKAILDGHIVLSRRLAESGLYPAIDIDKSISRVMPQIASADHRSMAAAFRRCHSEYEQNADLFAVGAYQAGSNPLLDLAVQRRPAMVEFLSQGMDESVSVAQAIAELTQLMSLESNTTNVADEVTADEP